MSNHSLIIRLLREVILHFLFRNRLSGGKVESVNNILEEYNFFVFTLFQVGLHLHNVDLGKGSEQKMP